MAGVGPVRFTIDGASGTAPFDQVRSQIVAAVRSGQLIAGSKLPTVRALAATLDLAPNTVAKAYRELEKDGVIETRGRSGTFVAAGGDPSAGAVQLAATEYVRAARRAGIDDEVALRYVRTALADS
ncbi:GntR family transcriptional regulator [Rhodococcus sp. BP-349]|uniref:GntR family transcriptional regulator n=1 Tax=unclassified Rhodococcus (in: high G+C Gram-positive bacteria) TaxID=192944 RepID=UPI001C9AF7A6|nr:MULTISPECIES: GntR family transcriptional regulator [unclassified Rhodococcus (in: high G+C Gram-positive bacteria)]MBY6606610.1 GntR family transcriptional regulator [Rhodococcus sp. BP-361]MBY6667335.1 GntR family transcriptional regulator [Rhodococcus sp. BP-334]MBY6671674.1 GntR family transcriptional regulator [Rhodococcus sp. BP-333]MBY6538373.1 GntR family transcriptional regulator [Rhodococcus sp. BP-363]MBY6542710.1 GntR family transcriptional regulator [Rhodococcus sp. BP-369]